MPHALLLSPDDQAVSAITAVLEEMSVTCERPLDGASAAQKLNAHSFDLVLVDCENLPAAKLIFDVCRRGKNGYNPVPIAIVDGRAGLPTAFRLGAELILTKPVAKDQARSTIRTAVGRVRKDGPTKESVPAPPAAAAMPSAATTSEVVTSAVMTSAVVTEEHAQAAAAAAVSSQLTNFADPAPTFVPSAAADAGPSPVPTAPLSAPALTVETLSAVDEIDASPATPESNPQSAPSSASSSESSLDRAVAADSKAAHPVKPSDDPVLAELERTEQEELALAESQAESSALEKTAPHQPAAESVAPVFSSYQSSYQQGQQKTRAPLVALLMLALAGAGFYAAWTYQPGFRAIAQPQIDRVLALAGMALPGTSAPSPAKPAAQLAPAATSATAPQSSTDPNQAQSPVPDPATSSATSSTPTSAAANALVQPATTPGAPVTPAKSGATTAVAPVVSKPVASKPSDSKNDAAALTSANAELPGENIAIILSSKGAEKRLAHSVSAQYPVEARAAQGTVVLKEVVDETGKVAGVRLVEGDATLATAAIQAVKQWRYRPYVRDGKAQPFQTVVIVDFQKP